MDKDLIKQEAKRRIDSMSEQEKKDIWEFSDEDNEFLDYVSSVGRSKLNEKQKRKFGDLYMKHTFKCVPGGGIQGSFVSFLEEEFDITRDDLRNGVKKNPFKAGMLRYVLLALIVTVSAAVLAFVGLAPAAIAVETTTGVLAMGFANQVRYYFEFRKIRKKFMSGQMDEEEIKAEVYEQLLREREKQWERKHY